MLSELRVLDLHRDVQLEARQHFLPVARTDFEGCMVESSRLLFSRTPPRPPVSAPWFGIETDHVLSDLLGYSSDEIRHLEQAHVLL